MTVLSDEWALFMTLIIFCLIVIAVFIFLKKSPSNKKLRTSISGASVNRGLSITTDLAPNDGVRKSLGIKPTQAMIEWATKGQALGFDYINARLTKEGYVRHEYVSAILEKMKAETSLFEWGKLKSVFIGETLLSVEEKQKYGLPIKRKFYREFVDQFNLDMKRGEDPRFYIERIYLTGMHKASRASAMWRAEAASISRFIIRCPKHCALHKRLEGRKITAEKMPELPPDGCTGGYCGCYLEPIIPI